MTNDPKQSPFEEAIRKNASSHSLLGGVFLNKGDVDQATLACEEIHRERLRRVLGQISNAPVKNNWELKTLCEMIATNNNINLNE